MSRCGCWLFVGVLLIGVNLKNAYTIMVVEAAAAAVAIVVVVVWMAIRMFGRVLCVPLMCVL